MKLSDILTYKKPINRTGMFSSWTAQVGDITSVQPSKELAEQEVLTAVVAAVSGTYVPAILFKEDYYALCWRDTMTWCYAIQEIGKPVHKAGWTMGFASREECIEYASKHLDNYVQVI